MENIKRNKRYWSTLIILILLIFAAVTVYQNLRLKNTYYDLSFDHLPDRFSGYRIAQISDLHNAELGKNNSQLIDSLRQNKPDIIVLTGDLLDSNHTDVEVARDFIKQAKELAPCYFVTGNHEAWLGHQYEEFEKELAGLDVVLLRNQKVILDRGMDKIELIGVDDPDFVERDSGIQTAVMHNLLEDLGTEEEAFTILLSHRPELFDVYANHSIDLVLSGHAHGGQFRIPFIGGLVAPNQGFFPQYDSGVFEKNRTNMVVSKGIGNSIIPVRVNNQPEIVYIHLMKK